MKSFINKSLNTDRTVAPLLFVLAVLVVGMVALYGVNFVWGMAR